MTIVELTTTIALSIFFPPLGYAVGLGWAAYHEDKADEKLSAWRALIDPEMAFNYAEIEAELFAADLGVLLSLLPGGRVIGKVGVSTGRFVLRGEMRVAARHLVRQVTRRFLVSTLRALQQDIIKAFVVHIGAFVVMNEVLQLVLAPVMEEIQRRNLSLAQLEALASEVQPA